MIQAYIVYFFLLILMVYLAIRGGFSAENEPFVHNRNYILLGMVSVAVFSLIIGMRFVEGGDFLAYYEYYNVLDIFDIRNKVDLEAGYFGLMVALKYIGFGAPVLFVIVAFLQIFFIYRWGFNYKFLLPWLVFFYFCSLYLFESMNIMRQAIAFSILLYNTRNLIDKKLVIYMLWVLAAMLFHQSAIVFIPVYFLFQRDWLKSVNLQLVIFAAFTAVAAPLLSYTVDNFELLAEMAGYDNYANIEDQDELFFDAKTNGFGLAYFFTLGVNILLIFFSRKLKDKFADSHFHLFYNLYFIAILWSTVAPFANSVVLSRAFFYFISLRFVVLSFFFYYIFRYSNQRLFQLGGVALALFYLAWFGSAIYKGAALCSPFQFYFQV